MGFLNAMMQKIARNAGCNDACQRRRKIDELRAKWVLAADAEKAAPEVTESAEKGVLCSILKGKLDGMKSL